MQVLDKFLQTSYAGREDADNYIAAVLTTTDVASVTAPSRTAPAVSAGRPFRDWSADDCYVFFQAHVRPLGGEISGAWPYHSFVVLDARTAQDGRTCLLCSDVPDYLERERVVLKRVRCDFRVPLLEAMCYETFVRCPSESGNGALAAGDVVTPGADYMALSIMPPPMSGPDKRAVASFGLVNDSIPEGRRWWDRYRDETEGKDEAETNGKD